MPDPTMQRLRAAALAAGEGRPLPPDVAAWFASGVQRYEASAQAGAAIGLDVALQLGRPGAHGWWTVEARERRDTLLRRLRAECFADLGDGEAARRIGVMVRGVHHPLLTQALSCGLGIPGHKHLRVILAATSEECRDGRTGNLLP